MTTGAPRAVADRRDPRPRLPAHAVLAVAGRDDLPFAPLHGVPLYLHALRSLVAASPEGVSVVVGAEHEHRVRDELTVAGLSTPVLASATWWAETGPKLTGSLLVHDPLCPLTSTEFLAEVRRAGHHKPGVSLAAFRPVTDTVKTVVDERIHGTIDREGLAALIAPVLIAAPVLRGAVAAGDEPPLSNFGELLGWLRSRGPVELVKGPSLARRVDDASAVNLLECVDEVGRSVHTGPGGGGRPAG
jgi:2-C-methyl-D-erythritol 4-phosphate cytidylyltransferase